MTEIKNCPSLLLDGFNTYSPKATKMLFNGVKVSILILTLNEFRNAMNCRGDASVFLSRCARNSR